MQDNPHYYRVLLTLSDGRQVYTSQYGKVEQMDSRRLASIGIQSLPRNHGYSRNLGIFGPVDAFRIERKPYLVVWRADVEDADAPLTPGAFVLGGTLAAEAGVIWTTRDVVQ